MRCVSVKVPSRDALNFVEAVCMEPALAIACSVVEFNGQSTERLLPPSMLHRMPVLFLCDAQIVPHMPTGHRAESTVDGRC